MKTDTSLYSGSTEKKEGTISLLKIGDDKKVIKMFIERQMQQAKNNTCDMMSFKINFIHTREKQKQKDVSIN